MATEILPDGTPAFREIILSLPRQQGKTLLSLAFAVERCTLRGKEQRVAYSAQTGADARKKLLDDQVPLLMQSPMSVTVDRVNRAAGNVGVQFANGSRIDVVASSVSAGHGRIVDLAQLDEAFDDVDDRREQAMLPAMITRADAQLMIVSTMGTDASLFLNRKVDAGRAAALAGQTTGIAYFEWSIPDSEDIDDETVWMRHIPALGRTISIEALRHARQTMTESEFRRAFCNQRQASAERVIPEATWRMVCSNDASPTGALTFAVDVARDRDWSAIVACGLGSDDMPILELVDHRPGVGWVAERVNELRRKHRGTIVVEARSPAAALSIQHAIELPSADAVMASAAFYDAVADNRLRVRTDHRFDAALLACSRQPVGESWRFGRKSNADVTPIVAATLALHRHTVGKSYKFFAI